MSDVGLLLLFAAIALGAAWVVNFVVALLSGEHSRDTRSVWLDIMLGEWRGFSGGLSFIRPRWVRWTIAAVLGGAVFMVLLFMFHE
jgi:hypothetical protein